MNQHGLWFRSHNSWEFICANLWLDKLCLNMSVNSLILPFAFVMCSVGLTHLFRAFFIFSLRFGLLSREGKRTGAVQRKQLYYFLNSMQFNFLLFAPTWCHNKMMQSCFNRKIIISETSTVGKWMSSKQRVVIFFIMCSIGNRSSFQHNYNWNENSCWKNL